MKPKGLRRGFPPADQPDYQVQQKPEYKQYRYAQEAVIEYYKEKIFRGILYNYVRNLFDGLHYPFTIKNILFLIE